MWSQSKNIPPLKINPKSCPNPSRSIRIHPNPFTLDINSSFLNYYKTFSFCRKCLSSSSRRGKKKVFHIFNFLFILIRFPVTRRNFLSVYLRPKTVEKTCWRREREGFRKRVPDITRIPSDVSLTALFEGPFREILLLVRKCHCGFWRRRKKIELSWRFIGNSIVKRSSLNQTKPDIDWFLRSKPEPEPWLLRVHRFQSSYDGCLRSDEGSSLRDTW